eukprot:TRINITY_DN7567_c0_g2_i6.p1 TRINITY_DN7567_c0_g2~~TRINITY_DN7567_c0_g2_i6.p1  ORF type:complete len:845 (+),score=210.14 TRINITY_DN7567_c0_g2_i6:1403-3937(+)
MAFSLRRSSSTADITTNTTIPSPMSTPGSLKQIIMWENAADPSTHLAQHLLVILSSVSERSGVTSTTATSPPNKLVRAIAPPSPQTPGEVLLPQQRGTLNNDKTPISSPGFRAEGYIPFPRLKYPSVSRQLDFSSITLQQQQQQQQDDVALPVADPVFLVQGSSFHDAYKNNGGVTTTHIRVDSRHDSVFPPGQISSGHADLVSCHHSSLVGLYDVVDGLRPGGVLLIACPWGDVNDMETTVPKLVKRNIARKQAKLCTINLPAVVAELGLMKVDSKVRFDSAPKAYQHVLLGATLFLTGLLDSFTSTVGSKLVRVEELDMLRRVKEHIIHVPYPSSWADLLLEEGDVHHLPSFVSCTLMPGGANREHVANGGNVTTVQSTTTAGVIDQHKGVRSLSWYHACWAMMFPEAMGTRRAAHPHIPNTHLLKITENRRLTPASYDRNVFHMEMKAEENATEEKGEGEVAIQSTSSLPSPDEGGSRDQSRRGKFHYDVGEALGVHGHNDVEECRRFLSWYGLAEGDLVALPIPGSSVSSNEEVQMRSVLQVFVQYMDIFGRPNKRFYEGLAAYATDATQHEKLVLLAGKEGVEEFKKRVDETATYADVLHEFPSAHPTLSQLLDLVPVILPRHYSIASSIKAHPNSVHLLIVTNDWKTPSGRYRIGQCTRYLQDLKPNTTIVASIKPSVMVLPSSHEAPVVMAGLGTGMAPFRAFIEERAHMRRQGHKVGPMALYFGSRSRHSEYLYGEEIDEYHRDGLLTHVGLAFSRDQAEKIYIQHKITQDQVAMDDLLSKRGDGHFYLCGPTWPAGDVQDAIVQSFQQCGGMQASEANDYIKRMKKEGRYVLEVY